MNERISQNQDLLNAKVRSTPLILSLSAVFLILVLGLFSFIIPSQSPTGYVIAGEKEYATALNLTLNETQVLPLSYEDLLSLKITGTFEGQGNLRIIALTAEGEKILIDTAWDLLNEGGTLYMEADMDHNDAIREMVKGTKWSKLEFWPDPYGATPNVILRR